MGDVYAGGGGGTLLFAFVADDGADGRVDGKVAVHGCLQLDVLECAEDEVREGACESHGVVEGRGVEVVLACLGRKSNYSGDQTGGLSGVQVLEKATNILCRIVSSECGQAHCHMRGH